MMEIICPACDSIMDRDGACDCCGHVEDATCTCDHCLMAEDEPEEDDEE